MNPTTMLEGIPERSGIYAIINHLNGYRYVGQAKNMLTRLRSHLSSLEKGTHRTNSERLLQNAWDEFGRDEFEFVVLEEVEDNSGSTDYHKRPDNLSLAEHYYINLQSEYNADKRIVRSEFHHLIEGKAWRKNEQNQSPETRPTSRPVSA